MLKKSDFFSIILLGLLFQPIFAQTKYFPEKGEWQEKQDSEYNLDLTQVVEFAQNNEYSGAKDLRQAILKGFEHEPYHQILGPTKGRGGPAGMIIKDGYLIAKWGDTKRVDMTFSVTKSFLSTTALIALDKGLINSLDQPVKNFVWDKTFEGTHNAKITWKHLLQQTSDWSGSLWGSYDWADRPPREGSIDEWKARKLNEPGTHFKYNDVRVNVLAYSLLQVFREPLPKVLKKEIMDPIGASPTWRWFGYDNSWVSIDGFKMQSVSGGGHSGGGMFINTEDMARFGYLFLNEGTWKDQQILPANLVNEITDSSEANRNYGYMWWLNRAEEPQWESINRDIFYAAGFGGNFIIVDRTNDMVIVTRWLEPSKLEKFVQLVNKSLNNAK
ncbi:serine hydrolase domain-containing protein [Salegentibacter sediminis]|uniref:serine hydrolase domain-containing protein n=1 Tax=Salegentibacter sediminis TaxID=1930251 RepID=UPI0009C15ABE|nr:serine hydrolase [Salegentibacter sediminis]